jgi:ferredoxin-NADP reductase
MSVFQQPADAAVGLPPAVPTIEAAAKPALEANATLAARIEVTDSMAVFSIVPDNPINGFKPGQYLSLGIVIEDGALLQRAYSIVGVSGDGYRVELFIRRVPDGALSPRLWTLPSGTRVRLGPPKGLFVLDPADVRPRTFVGTGTGLAPLLAMLAELAARGDRSPNVLIHGVSYRDELAYADRVAGWVSSGMNVWYVPAVSRPDDPRNAEWSGTTGRADAVLARVLSEDPALVSGVAYMCGNGNMLESCAELLLAAGMRAEDVRREHFEAPKAPRPS